MDVTFREQESYYGSGNNIGFSLSPPEVQQEGESNGGILVDLPPGTLNVRHVEPEGNVEAEPEDGARVDKSRRWKD